MPVAAEIRPAGRETGRKFEHATHEVPAEIDARPFFNHEALESLRVLKA